MAGCDDRKSTKVCLNCVSPLRVFVINFKHFVYMNFIKIIESLFSFPFEFQGASPNSDAKNLPGFDVNVLQTGVTYSQALLMKINEFRR